MACGCGCDKVSDCQPRDKNNPKFTKRGNASSHYLYIFGDYAYTSTRDDLRENGYIEMLRRPRTCARSNVFLANMLEQCKWIRGGFKNKLNAQRAALNEGYVLLDQKGPLCHEAAKTRNPRRRYALVMLNKR